MKKKNTKHAEEIKRPSAGKNTNEKFKMVSAGEEKNGNRQMGKATREML